MDAAGLLTDYFYFCSAILVIGWISRIHQLLGRNLRLGVERSPWALNPPLRQRLGPAFWSILTSPWRRFHWPANPWWARGYLFYHAGIITIVAGYALASVMLAWRWAHGAAIPDLARGVPTDQSTSPANLLAMIFGSGESLPQHFLFGRGAPVFMAVSWLELVCAAYGNGWLLASLFLRGQGSLRGDLDPAASGLRKPGTWSWSHALVRCMIFSIILTEILARFGLWGNVRYLHAGLGLTLLTLLPYTYVHHVLLVPLAWWRALQRRRYRTVA